MTYSEAIEYIHSLMRFGSRPGLDSIRHLLEAIGNPQDRLSFIHVAGTNGKGSTCAFISSVLRSSGLKTGLYTSPYVVCFNERIQIGGKYISDDELAEYTEQMKKISEKISDDDTPITEFEFITALAFKYFFDKGCDIVVLEVGLGGRLDATNVIKNPLASVITRIDLDHTAVLGGTIAEIAYEKCGIIKQGCEVITTGDNSADALGVIARTAAERACNLTVANAENCKIISSDIFENIFEYSGARYKIQLPGAHQITNAVTAIETVRTVFPDITSDVIDKGLHDAVFPARCEVISKNPLVVLDGSHNPNGTAALDVLLTSSGINDAVAIAGFMADKDVSESIKTVAGHFSHMIAVKVTSNKRTMSADRLSELCSHYCSSTETADSYEQAIAKAISFSRPIIVFGSLYLAGDIRPLLLSQFATKNH